MPEMMLIESAKELSSLTASGDVAPLGSDEFSQHRPDAHWALLDDEGNLAGRCSLWWRAAPTRPGARPGVIGHYAANEAGTAGVLLAHACRELARNGCTLAIGPMDGNTWRRYRFVTRRGSEPPFFLEPDNPDDYPRHFEAAGFSSFARYYSNLDPDLGWSVAGEEKLAERLRREGVTFRPLETGDFEEELARIYALSTDGFRNNLLYTPIGREEFTATYARVEPFVRPELVLFAEREGSPVGFVFALPDMLRQRRGEALDTVILKSLAILPAWNGRGIGPLLMSMVTANARELGFRRAIHALMHEDNRSRALSDRHGAEIRQYTLYGRRLS